MDHFEFKDGKLYHSRGDQLMAVVPVEHLDAYREFVPEAPQPEAPASDPAAVPTYAWEPPAQ